MGLERDFVRVMTLDRASFSPGMNLILQVRDTGHRYTFDVQNVQELLIGRKDPAGASTPDVDLSQDGAFKQGVSRKHAAIIYKDGSLQVVDRGSSNGTFLNGRRLIPGQPCLLRDGDELLLGQLALRIQFQRPVALAPDPIVPPRPPKILTARAKPEYDSDDPL